MTEESDRSTIRLLTFSTLYPNAAQPGHGLFVEQRLRKLVETGAVEVRVLAPVPWFPFNHKAFGKYCVFASVSKSERRYDIEIDHPRYPVVPKVGMSLAPLLLAAATIRSARSLLGCGYAFELIDAHYFYPDGVAAVLIGRRLGKPVFVTARGSDVNLIPQHPVARRWILWAARHAAGIITVSGALKSRLVDLGVAADKIRVLRNGVDLGLFRPVDQGRARNLLRLEGPVLLSVGNLVELKGHHIAIESLKRLPGVQLVVLGEGDMMSFLKKRARVLGVANRVRFVGRVDQKELPLYYSAADALVLASSREGWANVLLESMACGTPVIATSVGGNPEVVRVPEAGILMANRDSKSLAEAYGKLQHSSNRAATRRYAKEFSWDRTTLGQIELMSAIVRPELTKQEGVSRSGTLGLR